MTLSLLLQTTRLSFLSLLILLYGIVIFPPLQAKEATEEKKQHLYIGIQKNRLPYTHLDDKQHPYGLLVDATRDLCKAINAECTFVTGEFDQLVQDLQTYQLNALLVIDAFLLVKLDKLKLTPPLCVTDTVFIQSQHSKPRNKPEDFKNTTIGVLRGSLQHFYLLDHYSRYANFKSYLLLESGVFDLSSGRIDSLLTDETFFKVRIQQTPLGQAHHASTLIKPPMHKKIILPAPSSMTIALREQDVALHKKLTAALAANGSASHCNDLLPTPDPVEQPITEKTTEPAPDSRKKDDQHD